VAVSAIIENIVPPAPADVVVTLAAFLSTRGATDARMVFLVTWVSNVGGALLVYALARHLGQGFVASRLGQRLIAPEAIVGVERGYLRFGLVGLFTARLLPGFRSFTAPFAGLVGLSLPRTILPIAAASALWYGGLVFLGARLGANWDQVAGLLARLNTTLGIVAAAAALVLIVWMVRRIRRRRRAERRERFEASLAPYPSIEARALRDPAAAAVAAFLLELTLREQGILSDEELAALETHLRSRFHLGAPEAPVLDPVEAAAMAARLAERMEAADRAGLAHRLRNLAFGPEDREHETRVMERAARLLGLGDPGAGPDSPHPPPG